MKPNIFVSLALAAATQFTGSLAATRVIREDPLPTQAPSTLPIPGNPTSHGCYSSGGNLTKTPVAHMSSGSCKTACMGMGAWVYGLHGNDCVCGNAYPPADDLSKDSNCNYPCPSYPLESCGGLGEPSFYSIFNSGINIDVPDYVKPKITHSTTSSAAAGSTPLPDVSDPAPPQATTTEIETASAKPDADNGRPNIAAIVAGVVVGVVLIAALIGGGFLYMRRKRNAEIEEEHRRNAAVNAFISGSKPPSSNGSISMTDSRLDPVLAHRRLSDGSIADNQDYSRKILRVTNA